VPGTKPVILKNWNFAESINPVPLLLRSLRSVGRARLIGFPLVANCSNVVDEIEATAALTAVQARVPLATAMSAVLLTVDVFVPICTVSGTAHPVGALFGTVNTTWSSPMQHPERP